MSTDLERKLHAAFERLTDTPAPPGLAPGIVRRTRQQRQLRLATAGVAVAAVAAGGYAGATAWSGRDVAAAAGGSLAITSLSCQPGNAYQQDDPKHSRVLDQSTGRYVTVPYCGVVPAPDGRHAVVTDGGTSKADPERQGILDLATNKITWIQGYTGIAVWSPDGTQVMLRGKQAGLGSARPLGATYAVVEADTGAVRVVPLAATAHPAGPVWRPNGTIALVSCQCPQPPASRGEVVDPGYFQPAEVPAGGASVPGGAPSKTVTTTLPSGAIIVTPGKNKGQGPVLVPGTGGAPTAMPDLIMTNTGRDWTPLPMISPDGKRVAFTVSGGMDGPVVFLADSATGKYLGRVDLPRYNEVVGWYDVDHLVTHYLPRRPAPGAKDTDEVISVVSVRTGKVDRAASRDTGYGPIEFDANVTIGMVSGPARKVGF
jgi:hypothetical protein